MSAPLPVVTSGPNHLKCCKLAELTGDRWIKCVEDTRTSLLNAVSTYPRSIPVESASALINCVVEDSDLFGLQDRCAIVDSVNSKTCQNDYIGHIADPKLTDKFTQDKVLPRQSMYYVENYFTQRIWQKLREPNLNRQMVHLEITKLLVQLGLHRPQEKSGVVT